MRTLLAALIALALAACAESASCTTEARASVQLTVVDAGGAPVPGATGTFSGGGFTDEPCMNGGGELVCGWEVEGPIAITVSGSGYVEKTVTVQVALTDDGCHVETQKRTVTLLAETD